MNPDDKKTALRMLPYGLYVLTAQATGRRDRSCDSELGDSGVLRATPGCRRREGWVGATQGESRRLARSLSTSWAKNQQSVAYTFFKPVTPEGQTLGGEPFRAGSTGAPVLERVPGYVECSLVETVEKGDHAIIVGEVVDAGVSQKPSGRADDLTLALRDLGENVYYGG